MSKFCTNCGSKLEENDNVCGNCGVVVNKGVSVHNQSSADKDANTGFILGMISIIAWFIPLFGYPVTICGIIFSSKGLKATEGKAKAIVGLVFSILFLIVTLINSILGAIINLAQFY